MWAYREPKWESESTPSRILAFPVSWTLAGRSRFASLWPSDDIMMREWVLYHPGWGSQKGSI